MNEIEFRRRAISNPRQLQEEKLSLSPEQQRFLEQRLEVDEGMRKAFEVEVPEGLEDRVLLRHSFVDEADAAAASKPERSWRQWAMAASLVLAVLSVLWMLPGRSDLGSELLAHVEDELHHLEEYQPAADSSLKLLLAGLGASWNSDLLPISYAGACRIRGKYGLHVVTKGEQGPVTVLILPDEEVTASRRFAGERFTGRVLSSGSGAMALIGESQGDLDQVEESLKQALVWQG